MKSKVVGVSGVSYKGKDGVDRHGVRVYVEEPLDSSVGVGVRTKDVYFPNKSPNDFPLKEFTCIQYDVGFSGKAVAVGIIW